MKRNHVFAPYIMENTVNDLRVADLLRMTHLNISFAHVKNSVVTVDHLQFLDRIAIYKKINHELRVNLSIGGWSADGFSQAAMTKEGRKTFADTAMEIVLKWDFDGIDIDWEYPCSDQAGIAYAKEDKENFTLLMAELRQALDMAGLKNGKKYELSCAVGGEQYFIDGTQMDKVSRYVDYVNLMTYDLRGGFTDITGHHANLYPQTGDENGPCGQRTAELFHKAGVPYEKMVLGAAFYGRKWEGVSNGNTAGVTDNNGLGQKASTVGIGGSGYDGLKAEFINKSGYTRYWDEQAQAPFLFNGDTFISYEDEMSIKAKCRFIEEKGLAGIMYWAYGSHDLFDVIAANLD